MCSYLHKAPNGVYYFRMVIPVGLRSFMGSKREIKMSLGLKDREAAKLLIPDHTKAAQALLEQAKRRKAVADAAALTPKRVKSPARIERERAQWEFDQEQTAMASDAAFAADMEIEELALLWQN